jgi:hypothetical protein
MPVPLWRKYRDAEGNRSAAQPRYAARAVLDGARRRPHYCGCELPRRLDFPGDRPGPPAANGLRYRPRACGRAVGHARGYVRGRCRGADGGRGEARGDPACAGGGTGAASGGGSGDYRHRALRLLRAGKACLRCRANPRTAILWLPRGAQGRYCSGPAGGLVAPRLWLLVTGPLRHKGARFHQRSDRLCAASRSPDCCARTSRDAPGCGSRRRR